MEQYKASSPPMSGKMVTRSPQSPLGLFSPLQKIFEEADESDPPGGRHEDTPIPKRRQDEQTTPETQRLSKKTIFDYERANSPVRNVNGKQSPEKESAKAPIQADEFMFYSKQDIDALLNQINGLQHKLELLSTKHRQAIDDLETQQFHSAELALKLQQQEKHFQSMTHQNMALLSQKAKEQEQSIQSIKVTMQNMTKSYRDKSDELENKKRKLMMANKEVKESAMQLAYLKQTLKTKESEGKEKGELLEQVKEQMAKIRAEYEQSQEMYAQGEREWKIISEKNEEELRKLRAEVEELQSSSEKQDETAEENKTLIKENTELYAKNEEIMNENRILKQYLESVKEQNLNPVEELEYDDTKIDQPEIKMFDEDISRNKDANSQNLNDQTFNKATAKQPQTKMQQDFYNPVPQRSFNKFSQPSLNLVSASTQPFHPASKPTQYTTQPFSKVNQFSKYVKYPTSQYALPVNTLVAPVSLSFGGGVRSNNGCARTSNARPTRKTAEDKYMFN